MAPLRIMATGAADSEAIRVETFRGKQYTVVPVIALVEGVIQGLNALTPEFAPAAEFGKYPMTWNGRPITMNHPRRDGELTSANDPDIREEYEFGFIANTELSDTKLKMEAWIDEEIAAEKGGEFQETVDRLKNGNIVEVSTGLFTEVVAANGYHNNQPYAVAWQGVVPDHLAMLSEGTIGACSVADGCGAPRLNGSSMIQLDPAALIASTPVVLGRPHTHKEGACCDACAKGDTCMSTNTGGGNATGETIEPEEPPVVADTAVGSGTENQQQGSGEEQEAQEPGEATTEGSEDPVEVTQELEALQRFSVHAVAPTVTFENAREIVQQALRAKYPAGTMSDCGCYHYRWVYILAMTADMVAFETWESGQEAYCTVALEYSIDANGGVTFTGEPVPVNLLVSIVPKPGEPAEADISANGATSGANQQQEEVTMADNAAGTEGSAAGVTANGAESPAPRTLEQYLADAPPEVALVLNESLALRTQKKNDLVTKILANSSVFSKEELEGKDIPELEKLHTMSTPKADYSGQAMPRFVGVGGDISANSREDQHTVPEAPRAFTAKPAHRADYSQDNQAA